MENTIYIKSGEIKLATTTIRLILRLFYVDCRLLKFVVPDDLHGVQIVNQIASLMVLCWTGSLNTSGQGSGWIFEWTWTVFTFVHVHFLCTLHTIYLYMYLLQHLLYITFYLYYCTFTILYMTIPFTLPFTFILLCKPACIHTFIPVLLLLLFITYLPRCAFATLLFVLLGVTCMLISLCSCYWLLPLYVVPCVGLYLLLIGAVKISFCYVVTNISALLRFRCVALLGCDVHALVTTTITIGDAMGYVIFVVLRTLLQWYSLLF